MFELSIPFLSFSQNEYFNHGMLTGEVTAGLAFEDKRKIFVKPDP